MLGGGQAMTGQRLRNANTALYAYGDDRFCGVLDRLQAAAERLER